MTDTIEGGISPARAAGGEPSVAPRPEAPVHAPPPGPHEPRRDPTETRHPTSADRVPPVDRPEDPARPRHTGPARPDTVRIDTSTVSLGTTTGAHTPEARKHAGGKDDEKRGWRPRRKKHNAEKAVSASETGSATERVIPQAIVDQHVRFLKQYVGELVKSPDRSMYSQPGYETQRLLLQTLTDTPEGGKLGPSEEKILDFIMRPGGEGLMMADHIMMTDATEKLMAVGMAETFGGAKDEDVIQEMPSKVFGEVKDEKGNVITEAFRNVVTAGGAGGVFNKGLIIGTGAGLGGAVGESAQSLGQRAVNYFQENGIDPLLHDITDVLRNVFVTNGGTMGGMLIGGALTGAATLKAAHTRAAHEGRSVDYQAFATGLEAFQSDPARAQEFFRRTGVQTADWVVDPATGNIIKNPDPEYTPQTHNLDAVKLQILDAFATRRQLYEKIGMSIGRDSSIEQQLATIIARRGERQHMTVFDHEVQIELDPNGGTFRAASEPKKTVMLLEAKKRVINRKLEEYADFTDMEPGGDEARRVETIEVRIKKAAETNNTEENQKSLGRYEDDLRLLAGDGSAEHPGDIAIVQAVDRLEHEAQVDGLKSLQELKMRSFDEPDTRITVLKDRRKTLREEQRTKMGEIKVPTIAEMTVTKTRKDGTTFTDAISSADQQAYIRASREGQLSLIEAQYKDELDEINAELTSVEELRGKAIERQTEVILKRERANQFREQFVKGDKVVVGAGEHAHLVAGGIDPAKLTEPIERLYLTAKDAGIDIGNADERAKLIRAAVNGRASEAINTAVAGGMEGDELDAYRLEAVKEAYERIQLELEAKASALRNAKEGEESLDVKQAKAVARVRRGREAIMSRATELNAREGFSEAEFFNSAKASKEGKSTEEVGLIEKSNGAKQVPEFYYSMLNHMFDYQNDPQNPDRNGNFKTLSTLLPPEKMARIIHVAFGISARAGNLQAVVTELVSTGQTSEHDLRRMSKEIIKALVVETAAKDIK